MQHPPKVEKKRRKNRRVLSLILSLVCASLAAVFVLLLPVIKERYPTDSRSSSMLTLTYRTLDEGDREALESISVFHIASDSYTLRYQNGALLLERDGALLDINDTHASELLKAATQISVEDVVTQDEAEVAEYLGDMGLEPPQTTVRVRYHGGREVTIEIGSNVPETSYSYYRWSGDDGIYMCDAGINDAFSLTENRLLPVEQPVLEKTLIDRVDLQLKGSGKLSIAFSADSTGWVSGLLRVPYTYPLNATSTNAILTALENFRLGTREDEVSDENRAFYGFDDPLCVVEVHQNAGSRGAVNSEGQLVAELVEAQSLRFTIGRAEGDYFYTCEYEGNCYLISRFLAASLVGANPTKLITRNPADLGGAPLASLTVQTGAGALDIRIVRTERVLPNNQLETDQNGNPMYDTSVTANGEPMTTEQLDALVERLAALTVSGEVDAEWSPGGATPRWQLILTTTGGATRTIAAYPMDAFSDALVVDGVVKHYAHVEALEIAMAEWMPKAPES